MKLLFDQNLSPRLVGQLADVFPQSSHVQTVGLDHETDESVWQYALTHGYTIVTKDSDFQERSQVAGSLPFVVWIQRGNCSTADVEAMLRKHTGAIKALGREQKSEFLILL